MSPELSKDFSKYLRVPYLDKGRDTRGWDCFGLYRYLLAERLGVLLPDYAGEAGYASSENHASVAAFIGRIRPAGWAQVPTDEAREGDGAVFCIGGEPWHCGYVLERGIMLHARKGCGTVRESYQNFTWAKRLEGIYRCKL